MSPLDKTGVKPPLVDVVQTTEHEFEVQNSGHSPNSWQNGCYIWRSVRPHWRGRGALLRPIPQLSIQTSPSPEGTSDGGGGGGVRGGGGGVGPGSGGFGGGGHPGWSPATGDRDCTRRSGHLQVMCG